MLAVLGDIAYTFIPSLILGLYLGTWVAWRGDRIVTMRQYLWLFASNRVATAVGPLSYAITHWHEPVTLEFLIRVATAAGGNAFFCPVLALTVGGFLWLIRPRERSHK